MTKKPLPHPARLTEAVIAAQAAALDAIEKLLDRQVWTPDTLDAIAAVIRETGRVIRDPQPSPRHKGE